ncbi:MAG: WG repeat-containing protein [Bacteroidales bacterium]|nr:WG repeat-containing protein [Bacteroidales bacterium]
MKRIIIALLVLWTGIQTVSAQIPELKPLRDLDEELAPVQKKDKWGYANGRGKMIIKAVFDAAEPFESLTSADGTTMKVARIKAGGKWGYITRENVYLFTPDYDTISRFDNNALVVAQMGPSKMLLGVRTILSPKLQIPVLTGNVLQVNLNELCDFSPEGYAWASRAGKWGLLSKKGDWAVPCEYSSWYKMPGLDAFGVEKGEKAGIVSSTGKFIVPVEYDRLGVFSNNTIMVEKDGMKGVLAQNGREILPAVFQEITLDDNLGYVVTSSGMYGRYTTEGEEIYPCVFSQVPDPDNIGYIPLVKDGTYCIYIAGEGMYNVMDYDEKLHQELSQEEYEQCEILPRWLKSYIPVENNYVTMTSRLPSRLEIPEGFDGSADQCADIRFQCGMSLADVVLQDEFESIDPQVRIWDGGEKVYILLHAVEEFWVLYEYNATLGKTRTFSIAGNMECDPQAGVIAETGVWGEDEPLSRFIPMNFPDRAEIKLFPILRYSFHSWAGQPYVLLGSSILGVFEMMPAVPGETVYAGKVDYGPSGQYCEFHAHVRDAATNGIAMYELIATEHVYNTPGSPDELVAKTPVVVACGYIGLTRPFFTQPLFYEARDFSDTGAMVRIGDDWFAKSSADIAALDPFIQPEQ